MHQHATKAVRSPSHLDFTTRPLDPGNKLVIPNNHFNNQNTDVLFLWGLQLISEICYIACQRKIQSACPRSLFTYFWIFFSNPSAWIICICVTYSGCNEPMIATNAVHFNANKHKQFAVCIKNSQSGFQTVIQPLFTLWACRASPRLKHRQQLFLISSLHCHMLQYFPTCSSLFSR